MEAPVKIAVDVAVYTVGLPVAAVAGVALGGLLLRREGPERRPVLFGLAVAAGLLTALIGNAGLPPMPPVDTLHWIPYAALLALALLVVFDLWPVPHADTVAGLVAAAVLAVGGWLVFKPLLVAADDAGKWMATNAVLVVAPLMAFDRTHGRSQGPADVAALAFTAIGASISAVLAHSAMLGQVLGAVAAVLGAATVLAWRRPALAPGHVVTGVAYTTIALLVFYALGYADLPPASALLVLLAPRVAAVAARHLGGFRALALAGLMAALPGAAAAYLAFAATAESAEEQKAADGFDYDYDF